MTARAQITDEELALILEALDDAAYYRDARSRLLKSAVKRQSRRSALSSTTSITGADDHQRKAQAYQALAIKLQRKETQ